MCCSAESLNKPAGVTGLFLAGVVVSTQFLGVHLQILWASVSTGDIDENLTETDTRLHAH